MSDFDINIPITLQTADPDAITTSITAIAGTIPLNGAMATPAGVIFPVAGSVFISSAGDDSGITFTITGFLAGVATSEVLAGANTGVATSVNDYDFIVSIATSGPTSADIYAGFTSGGNEFALSQTLAEANKISFDGAYASRQIAVVTNASYLNFTCAGDETGNTFTIVGYDVNGALVTTEFAGVDATTYLIQVAYQTIISFTCSVDCTDPIQLGVADQTYTKWVKMDGQRDFLSGTGAILFDTGAVATATLQYGFFSNPYDPTSTLLGTVNDTILVGSTASTATPFNNPADAVRILVPSYTSGTLYFSVRQANSGHSAP